MVAREMLPFFTYRGITGNFFVFLSVAMSLCLHVKETLLQALNEKNNTQNF